MPLGQAQQALGARGLVGEHGAIDRGHALAVLQGLGTRAHRLQQGAALVAGQMPGLQRRLPRLPRRFVALGLVQAPAQAYPRGGRLAPGQLGQGLAQQRQGLFVLAAPLVQQPQLGSELGIGRLLHLPRNQSYGLIARPLRDIELGQLQLGVEVLGLGGADGLQHPPRWLAAPGLPIAATQH